MEKSADYHEICNFPLCPGAAHGKYIVNEASAYSGCNFINYKGTFNTVLLGVEDAAF